ncbi:hypothetical protein PR048_021112 [Dryococelus australis]|uniref:Uncharacterized protein n=1 Tax=Dryococelus australis TaxID=614101 RepID=A0ABQ9GXA6_9NEOP|nr:hypothetical protein PR048_021112 [Dryococelus australis]
MADSGLQALATIIKEDWPERKSDVPKCVWEYSYCTDELSVYDGTIFRGERLVVPQEMMAEMVWKAYASHQGLEVSLQQSHPHMKTQMDEVPDLPWKRVAAEVFQVYNNQYLILTDYYSDYWEIDAMPSTDSAAIIKVM